MFAGGGEGGGVDGIGSGELEDEGGEEVVREDFAALEIDGGIDFGGDEAPILVDVGLDGGFVGLIKAQGVLVEPAGEVCGGFRADDLGVEDADSSGSDDFDAIGAF